MNRALPPGDCGHRNSDPSRASGSRGVVLGTRRLVGGVAAARKEEIRHGAASDKDRPRVAAAIFLAKNLLGYRDVVANELNGPDGRPISIDSRPDLSNLSDEELDQL